MGLLLNKSLKSNYKKALEITDKNECDQFFNSLDDKSKNELITYVDCYVIQHRMKIAMPITEYFLKHYEDYMTEKDFNLRSKVDNHLNIIFIGVVILSLIIVLMIKYL